MYNKEMEAEIKFFKNVSEAVIPEIKLTRNKDKRSGNALFTFEKPGSLSNGDLSSIKGMYMIDKEGELFTRDVNIHFSNEESSSIQVKYKWSSTIEFERFMRFIDRYMKYMHLNRQDS